MTQISYNFEVISINEDARNMILRYTSDGRANVEMGTRLPYTDETLETIAKMYAPLAWWREQDSVVALPEVGQVGTVVDDSVSINKLHQTQSDTNSARQRRDIKLKDSDWSLLTDAPLTVEEKDTWVEYRQALRDVPQQDGFPKNIVWPLAPNQEPR